MVTCPVCKAENSQTAKFCQECGLRLEFQCPYCRAPFTAGAKFCSECGSNLDVHCAQCGITSRPGAKFCQQCGARLVTLCFQCQAPTPPGARFCQQCGARLERRCTGCGTPILYGARFCNGCGLSLSPAATEVVAAPAPLPVSPPVVEAPRPVAPVAEAPPLAPPSAPTAPPVIAPPPPEVAPSPPEPAAPIAEAAPPAGAPEAPAQAEPAPPLPEAVAPAVEQGSPALEVAPAPEAAAPVAEEAPPEVAPPRVEEAPPAPPAAAPPVVTPAPVHAAEAPMSHQDERRLVTVLFGDVSGFTAMSEKLDPEEVKMIMDQCLKGLADQVHKFDGTVDKFEGDLIMAVWGAPLAHEDDAERAVLAALDMQESLRVFGEYLQRRRGFTVKMRIGVNTGEVISGTVASGREKDYTVMGDVVNTASRFESNAQPGCVMVGEKTYLLTKHLIDYEELEPITVKGKTEPLKVYNALGVKKDRGRRRGIAGFESPMVGRGTDLETLLNSFREMAHNRSPHLVTILGAPGIGKSRLLAEYQRYLDAENISFAWCKGRCLPYGQGIAFYPLAEMLKSLFAIKESDPREVVQQSLLEGLQDILAQAAGEDAPSPEVAEEARQIAHRLGYAMGVSYPDSDLLEINPANLKEELFWAWRRFFARWASLQPLVVVVEDAHWADRVVLDLLESVVDALEDVPIQFVLVSRPEITEQAPALVQGANRSMVELLPLRPQEAGQLLDQLLSPNLLSRAWKERLVDAAGGVPFFLEEYIRSLMEEGRIVHTLAGWAPVETERLPDLPDTVFGTILARLDRLPAREKGLLQRAAVVGGNFWESSLSYPEPALEREREQLHGLLAKDWVKSVPASAFEGDAEYAFANGLARESAYRGLTRLRRSREHQRVAKWLEAKVSDRVEEFLELLAYHYGQGSLLEFGTEENDEATLVKAVTYGWQAAERARLQQAYADALSRYQSTSELLERVEAMHEGEPSAKIDHRPLWEMQIEVLLRIALVKEPLGQHDSALEHLSTIVEQANAHGSRSLAGTAFGQRARVLRLKGQPAQATTAVQDAIRLFQEAGDPSGEAQAMMTLGELYSDQAKLADFEAVCRQATELAKEHGPHWVEARGQTLLGTACIYQGKMGEAEAHLRAAAEDYQKLSDRRGMASSLLMLGRVLQAAGHSAQAIEIIERSFAIFDELGDMPMRVAALATLGQLHLERGNLEATRRYSERGVALARTVGQAAQEARCLLLVAQAELGAGQQQQAVDRLLETKKLCEESDQRAILPEVYRMLAQAYVGVGQPDAAEEYARLGRDVVEEDDHYSQGTTWMALAQVLACQGRKDEAEEAFGHALEDLEASGENYELGEAHLEYGEFLLVQEEKDRAKEHLDHAREAFSSLETRDKLDRITALTAKL
ncbi:MAG: tetratricopeptide repeat protein [Chloroflexi bacterium]|nr:tetratricopeptide repeat protein [Chloroflexota bacterium]